MTDTKPCKNTTGSPNCDDDDDGVAIELPGAVAPGAIIMAVLEERGLTPRKAATRADIDYETFFGVLSGVEPVTDVLAQKLPAAVGVNQTYWLRAEQSYVADLTRGGLERPEYDPAQAECVADQILGPAEDGLTEMELPVFDAEDDSLPE